MKPLGKELQNLQKVGSMEGRLISADPYLFKSFLSGDGRELPGNLIWGIKTTYLFGLDQNMPGPAKEASQIASYTIGGGNPSVVGSRSETVVFPFFSGSNNLKNLFGPGDWINLRQIQMASFRPLLVAG
jgi:hypothetical protein